MVSQRAKRRASYGVYAPAKASDVPLHNTRDSSDPLLSQPRQPHKVRFCLIHPSFILHIQQMNSTLYS